METTAPAVTPPPAGRRCSPKLKRLHREAAALPLPLGEVTNLLPSTPAHPTTGRPRPLPSDTSATASTCAAASSSLTPVSKPSSAAAAEERSLVESAISTVYTRRSTAEKRRRRGNLPTNDKMSFHAGTASCPPIARATRTNRKTSVDQDAWPVSSSAPCRQAKKKQNTRVRTLSSGKPVLPQDFVKKQRAYFEEIDAFELPEEEASETDLE